MKPFLRTIFVCTISLSALSACAPTFPKTGMPSPFDGQWTGTLTPKTGNCLASTLKANGEIRYGYVIGDISETSASGTHHYTIWGPIGSDNRLEASIGMAGISGGSADIFFKENSATGSWESSTCGGDADLHRVK